MAFVKDRVSAILKLLPEDDRAVMLEFIDLTRKESADNTRSRYEGPPWVYRLVTALVLVIPLASGARAAVGCVERHDDEESLRITKECEDSKLEALKQLNDCEQASTYCESLVKKLSSGGL